MEILPTLDRIKREAKKLRKKHGITHTQALETIAKQYGFANWKNCQRSLAGQTEKAVVDVPKSFELSFTDWLSRHVNRDSPLGDLAKDMSGDASWPSHDNLNSYRNYLESRDAVHEAVMTLERAWKTYSAYLKRKNSSEPSKPRAEKMDRENYDDRKIRFIKNVKPIPHSKRIIEHFSPGDKAWISWNGSKAIPVTVIEVNERGYTVRLNRPSYKFDKSTFSLYLDEVRSTPELACVNMVS